MTAKRFRRREAGYFRTLGRCAINGLSRRVTCAAPRQFLQLFRFGFPTFVTVVELVILGQEVTSWFLYLSHRSYGARSGWPSP